MRETNKFQYNYAAPTEKERKTAEEIRKRYLPEEHIEDKLERLQMLDRKAKNPPTALALSCGIGGTLLFGLGLTMILEWSTLLWGALVAVFGVIPLAFSYPVYRWATKRCKKKYAAEILRLSEEILKENK